MKTWRKNGEWQLYSACGEAGVEFIDEAHVPLAIPICGGCKTRPECIRFALDPDTGRGLENPRDPSPAEGASAQGIVAAGHWIPEDRLEDCAPRSRLVCRRRGIVLDKLAFMLDDEYMKRGEI
jgi:hypothetical protein